MKKVIVIETVEELVDAFAKKARSEKSADKSTEKGEEAVSVPAKATLEVGVIQNTFLGVEDEVFQLAPGITFEHLFFELCKRMNIPVVTRLPANAGGGTIPVA